MSTAPRDGGEEGAAVDLWAMAAELERQFAGYKERFAERTSSCVVDDIVVAADGDDDAGGALRVADSRDASSGEEEEDEAGDAGDRGGGGGGVRGRLYEAYTRRRDERLRCVWRARMERKEAEVMALWAQLRGGGPTAADDDGCCIAGEEAEDNGEKRRSSDVAAPGRVSGKKHPLARRSLSSANLTKSSRPDVGLRRALSQEPPSPEPRPGADGGSRKHGHRSRAVTGGAAPKRKALSGSKGLVKEHGSLRQTGKKPPRGGLPRQCSSGGLEAARLSNTGLATPARISISSDQAAASDRDDEAREASPPGPESDCGEVVDGAAQAIEVGEAAEAKNAVINAERRDGEEIAVQSPETEAKLGNGEVTSDSETEPSYVFIKKKALEEGTMRLSDALDAGSDAEPRHEGKDCTGDVDQTTTAADTAVGIAKTNAEEAAPEGESSDGLSSFSDTGRSGRDSSAPNSAPSYSSRSRSIERQLEEDAAVLRKKRQHHQSAGGRRSVQGASTPPSARNRGAASATRATSPRGTAMGFKKRFLSFGKKNRDGCTVIDCTSPASLPASPADSGGATRRCRTADPVRRRVLGSSSDDDTRACSLQSLVAASPAKSELGEIVPRERSPKSHRSFFSFRSFNCGRG